jgi:conjugal transfer pilus assembly protein TrbC
MRIILSLFFISQSFFVSAGDMMTGIAGLDQIKYREELLKKLNIDTEDKGNVYVFASTSMSATLIKSYVEDLNKFGGILVFRGKPEQDTFLEFLARLGDYQSVATTAVSQIDPRLFDAYAVDVVPTIVMSKIGSKELCRYPVTKSEFYKDEKNVKREISWQGCDALDPSTYFKLSGAVDIEWALDYFLANKQ